MPATATRVMSTFRAEYSVSISISADTDTVWRILTNGSNYPEWNSTIISLQGNIGLNEKIALKAHVAPEQTFKLKVSSFHPSSNMIWESGFAPIFKGVRTFTIQKKGNAACEFSMVERFSGLFFPLIRGSLPDFRQPFHQFASDLRDEAEK